MKPSPIKTLREMLNECVTDAAKASDSARWFHMNRRNALQYAIDQIKASTSVKARPVDSEGGGDLCRCGYRMAEHGACPQFREAKP